MIGRGRHAGRLWWPWLALWTAVGLGIRLGTVFGRPNRVAGGDAYYNHNAANLLVAGQGFINPFLYYPHRPAPPRADGLVAAALRLRARRRLAGRGQELLRPAHLVLHHRGGCGRALRLRRPRDRGPTGRPHCRPAGGGLPEHLDERRARCSPRRSLPCWWPSCCSPRTGSGNVPESGTSSGSARRSVWRPSAVTSSRCSPCSSSSHSSSWPRP